MNAGIRFVLKSFEFVSPAEVDAVVVCFHLKAEGSFRIF